MKRISWNTFLLVLALNFIVSEALHACHKDLEWLCCYPPYSPER